jgi:hypothetical protein
MILVVVHTFVGFCNYFVLLLHFWVQNKPQFKTNPWNEEQKISVPITLGFICGKNITALCGT